MKAITVEPKIQGSARFEDVPEPDVRSGSVLVEAIAKYKQYKWGIGKKSTRTPQIFDPKMTLNHP